MANTLHHLADVLEASGDLVRAQALAEEALDIARSVGDRFVTVRALIGLGRMAYARGELDSATEVLDEALTMAERDGFGHEVAEIAGVRGLVARDAGCRAQAAELGETALHAARQSARPAETARALLLLGSISQRPHAARLLQESLGVYRQLSDRIGMAAALVRLANAFDDPEVGVGWCAAAAAVLREAGTTWSLERYELQQALGNTPVHDSPAEFDRAVEEALSAKLSG